MDAGRVVLRQSGAWAVPTLVWIFCLVVLLDAVVEGSAGYVMRTGLVMATVAYAAWMILASPAFEAGPLGIRIVNPFRVHLIPFGALVELGVRGLTTVAARTARGRERTFSSWNSPGQPRRSAMGSPQSAVIVERFLAPWERQHPHGQSTVATSAWRVRELTILTALVVANVAIGLR